MFRVFIYLSIIFFPFVGIHVSAGEIDDLKNQITEKESEIQELQRQSDEYKGVINQTSEEAKTLSEAVDIFNSQIRDVENDIAIKQKEISATNLNIKRTGLEIQAKEESIKRTKEYIAALLREIYLGDDSGVLELVLKHENFSDFFNQVEYRNLLQEDLKGRLSEIVTLKQKLEADKEDLDETREELLKLKDSLEDKNSILSYQKNQKQELLDETRNTEWRYKDLLKQAEDRQREVNREIFELEDALRRALDPDLIPAAFAGVLSWPAEGLFTQGYGCLISGWARSAYPSCNGGSGGFHNGVDVAASYGTPIKAARDGVVVARENSPYAYGKWVAVEHDNGLVTVYTHMSLQSVNVGQTLSRGELVGYMGSTGFSTGSHTHFMVYAPGSFSTKPSKLAGILPIGATLNPLDYLP